MKGSTGQVIALSDCTVLCQSKLKTETSLLAMWYEIMALAHCCK